MIDMHFKLYKNGMFYPLIHINNHVLRSISCMLSWGCVAWWRMPPKMHKFSKVVETNSRALLVREDFEGLRILSGDLLK